MPEPPLHPDRSGGRGVDVPPVPPALRGIRAILRSLGLGEREKRLIREAHPRIATEIHGWVDRFYARLLTDPVAADLLADEGRVIRLKRSLVAWFDEIFTLPFDEEYERARATIGQTHVRIGMPGYLMVTAMSGVRRDALRAVRAAFADDKERALETARAISLALDLELALMLEAYRRQDRQLMRQKDRAIYAERAVRRLADSQRDDLDAALCYVELAASEGEEARKRYLVKLRDLLLELGRTGPPLRTSGLFAVAPPRIVRVGDLCRLACDTVGFEPRTTVQIRVEPEDLEARIHDEAVKLALEELLQNAASHGAGGNVVIEARRAHASGQVEIEVRDSGPGWDAYIGDLRDVYARGIGLGLSFCELVAELHRGTLEILRPKHGGAGVLLTLSELTPEERA